jgi:tetratricopeptide (TPR) repeat protein
VAPVSTQIEEAAELAARGLELYGQGRSEEAAAAWRRALELDPSQDEARDYLRSAGFDDGAVPPAPPREVEAPAGSSPEALLAEVAELLARGQGREALGLLLAIAGDDEGLEVQATVDLLRAHLFAKHLAAADGGAAVPTVRVDSGELLRFNLSRDAGFVLSLVDGVTATRDLIALSGMDPFDALDALVGLEAGGLVEWIEVEA